MSRGATELEMSEADGEKVELWPEGSIAEADLLPEYSHYQDEGCDLAESCLNCPFPKCVYEEPGGKQHLLKRWRAREMARLFTTEGKGVNELALMFDVSQRTVQRILKTALGSAASRGVNKDE